MGTNTRTGGVLASLPAVPESRCELCSCGLGWRPERQVVFELFLRLGEKLVSERLVGHLKLSPLLVTGLLILI